MQEEARDQNNEQDHPEKKKKGRKGASKLPFAWVETAVKIVTGLSIVLGIVGTLLQYASNSRNQRMEAAREYQKSFYQAQMAVYAEAVNATAVLSTVAVNSENYEAARNQFLQLFWGRMSMFEDKCVESKMIEFRRLLIKFEKHDFSIDTFIDPCSEQVCVIDTVTQVMLKIASLRLAHQCRVYTIKTWLPENERSSYNLIDSIGCPHN